MGWRKNRVGSTRRGAFFYANLLASCPPLALPAQQSAKDRLTRGIGVHEKGRL